MARSEKGDYISSAGENSSFYKYILPYLKVQKDCNTGKGCFADVMIKTLNGEDWVNINNYTSYQKVILSDGAALQLYNKHDASNQAEIRVDINGFKAPNTLGKDIFYFRIRDNRVFPAGINDSPEDSEKLMFDTNCKRNSTADYAGDGCSAWVIFNENMDYLHCDDLSVNGKTKCNGD